MHIKSYSREILKLYDLDVNCRGEEELSAMQLAM